MSTGRGFKSNEEFIRRMETIGNVRICQLLDGPCLSSLCPITGCRVRIEQQQKAAPMTDTTEIQMLRDRHETLRLQMQSLTSRVDATTLRLDELLAFSAAPKPWPQVGDRYCFLNSGGEDNWSIWTNDGFDNRRRSHGNIFRTEDEAKDERDRRKIAAMMRSMADHKGFFVIRSMEGIRRGELSVQRFSTRAFGEVFFSTSELAQACLDALIAAFGLERLLFLWGGK